MMSFLVSGKLRTDRKARQRDGRHAFEPNSRERYILITINSTIFVTLWNVMDHRGFNCIGDGGGERQNG